MEGMCLATLLHCRVPALQQPSIKRNMQHLFAGVCMTHWFPHIHTWHLILKIGSIKQKLVWRQCLHIFYVMLDEGTLVLSSGESMSAVHILLFVVASLTLLNLSAWACYHKPTHTARRQTPQQQQFPGLCLKTQLPSSLHICCVYSKSQTDSVLC